MRRLSIFLVLLATGAQAQDDDPCAIHGPVSRECAAHVRAEAEAAGATIGARVKALWENTAEDRAAMKERIAAWKREAAGLTIDDQKGTNRMLAVLQDMGGLRDVDGVRLSDDDLANLAALLAVAYEDKLK